MYLLETSNKCQTVYVVYVWGEITGNSTSRVQLGITVEGLPTFKHLSSNGRHQLKKFNGIQMLLHALLPHTCVMLCV